MNSYLLADRLLQYGLNALFAFFLFSLLTEGALRIFKIRNPRLRACFRLLPLLRLALEPLFWLLPKSFILVNASIFSCSHPIQRFLFGMLSESTKLELSHFGLKSVIGTLLVKMPLPLLYLMILSVIALSFYKILTLFVRICRSLSEIRGIQKRANSHLRTIRNLKLVQQLKAKSAKVLFSREIKVPFAGWGKSVMIPQDLASKLHQNEYESVVSHELEHHLWHDTSVRLLAKLLAAFYWWIPTTKWLNKLEEEQEIACDAALYYYELQGVDLASALSKSVPKHQLLPYGCAAFTRDFTERRNHFFLRRIKAVLTPPTLRAQHPASAWVGLLVLATLALTLGFVSC